MNLPVFFRLSVGTLGCLGALLILVVATASYAEVKLRIVTPAGWVGFVADDHWPVLTTETKFPVAAMVFQIPNPADEGTPDSTNLVISLIEIGAKSEEASNSRAKIGKPVGDAAPVKDEIEGWTTYMQSAAQGSTSYILVDATKGVADVQVWVRLAWPVIGPNADAYHEEMGLLLETFLQSVDGGLGQ